MWESRRDFQEEWEGWEAGFMAFHPFHSSSFPLLRPATTDWSLRVVIAKTASCFDLAAFELPLLVLAESA